MSLQQLLQSIDEPIPVLCPTRSSLHEFAEHCRRTPDGYVRCYMVFPARYERLIAEVQK